MCKFKAARDTGLLGRIYDLKDTVKPPEGYLGATILRNGNFQMGEWYMVTIRKGLRQEC
jgi:hypothetical protein